MTLKSERNEDPVLLRLLDDLMLKTELLSNSLDGFESVVSAEEVRKARREIIEHFRGQVRAVPERAV